MTEQEEKVCDFLKFAIKASNGNTVYDVGLRNGMRYALFLLDGNRPIYESISGETE